MVLGLFAVVGLTGTIGLGPGFGFVAMGFFLGTGEVEVEVEGFKEHWWAG